jgi:hypothetical protein
MDLLEFDNERGAYLLVEEEVSPHRNPQQRWRWQRGT